MTKLSLSSEIRRATTGKNELRLVWLAYLKDFKYFNVKSSVVSDEKRVGFYVRSQAPSRSVHSPNSSHVYEGTFASMRRPLAASRPSERRHKAGPWHPRSKLMQRGSWQPRLPPRHLEPRWQKAHR